MSRSTPYRSTAVFNEGNLPQALRQRHETKAGVWGVIRMIEGRARLTLLDPPEQVELTPQRSGLLEPKQPHFVTPLGPMMMQIDFYDEQPVVSDYQGE